MNNRLNTLHQKIDSFKEVTDLGHQAATSLVTQAVEGGGDGLEALPNTHVNLHLEEHITLINNSISNLVLYNYELFS